MSRYRLSPRAQNDLREIVAWYRKHRGGASAKKTLRNIRSALRRLPLRVSLHSYVQNDI